MILARIRSLPGNAQGAVWILAGSLFLSANDAVVKTLGTDFHPIQMALFRYSIGMVLLAPWFLKAGRETWRTRRAGAHLARAVIAGVGQVAVYYAVIHLYLADATAVAFSRPLFLTLLAVLILGEAVRWQRWAATAFGFLGVLAMVRPGGAEFDIAWAVAVLAAILFALGIIFIRRLATTEPPIRILFYYQVFGIAMFLGPALALWQPPDAGQLALLVLIGALTCAGHGLFRARLQRRRGELRRPVRVSPADLRRADRLLHVRRDPLDLDGDRRPDDHRQRALHRAPVRPTPSRAG